MLVRHQWACDCSLVGMTDSDEWGVKRQDGREERHPQREGAHLSYRGGFKAATATDIADNSRMLGANAVEGVGSARRKRGSLANSHVGRRL